MKAILISIKPRYVAKILNGEKTIEVRKSMPKCDFPIDVYIYCTKSNYFGYISKRYIGKVVAKFQLNYVGKLKVIHDDIYDNMVVPDICITHKEVEDYLKDKIGYAWHISNLEIFDKPKELSEFEHEVKTRDTVRGYIYDVKPLTKAPQSWLFIEVEK